MPDHLGDDMRKVKDDKEEPEKEIKSLDEGDIALLKSYGQGQYTKIIKEVEDGIQTVMKRVNELTGIKESDTGLAPPALWDLAADKQTLQNEQPLQVARCTKIINADSNDPKYIINVKQFAKFVVDLADSVAPTDIEEGMRVGVDRNKYQIHIPLPPKIDPTVTMMQVEEKPDVTYSDVGGCKEQIEKLREVVETPLLHPEKFVKLGIEPPKGVLLFGPPGTGKTLCARAVANRTDACFIRVIGSELVQKYVGEGARMVRELFEMARSKKACLIFFDEIDAIGGARFDDGAGGDNEVQRTMLELINQLDGFDPRGNIKVLMATNRPDTLDPALMRPGRLDRKVEFGLPELEGRAHIFRIHARSMSVERDIRFDLLARLCPNSTGAEIRSVCTEAGMFAIRARRKVATEKDFLEAVNKDAYTDVVELCALLQCLGFHIKSLDITDGNVSQDGGTRTVIINCQASGFHVVMESANLTCSCPSAPNQQNSSFWQVSGMTGGKQYSKEYGSGLLGSLPKAHRERLTKELQEIVRCIKEHNESDGSNKECIGNKSASMIELKTPEKRLSQIKSEMPTCHRSLDTLTTGAEDQLPAPGPLQKQHTEDNRNTKKLQLMCQRQSTYTLSSTPGSARRRNKTSSPIQTPSNTVLESLIAAEKTAEELRNRLSNVIKEFIEDNKLDSSMSSLALDVSKISVLKGPDCSKPQFASSPNLSGMSVQDDFARRFKRVDSASTSNLAPKSASKDGKTSKLRRISPNLFKLRSSPSVAKNDKGKSNDNKSSKLNSLFKPKIVVPVRTTKTTTDASPNVSASRKKFSNVKSTIPRPASKKE
ncbi:unnamed protein product, partial [Brenthis ino]